METAISENLFSVFKLSIACLNCVAVGGLLWHENRIMTRFARLF
ncbi:hypothetical protein HMPREF9622_01852 [Cutibacterium modestum HL037PA3]|nr:hypothetical protein HMPREF9622_01852 [Cutibacterium modestum HL037PA3]EGG26436.1 hypothetical protein PA08_2408 [Cutibacterium modestum P08]